MTMSLAYEAKVFLACFFGFLAAGWGAAVVVCAVADGKLNRPLHAAASWLRARTKPILGLLFPPKGLHRLVQALTEDDPDEDGEQCLNCGRFTYDPHAGRCWHCGFQLHPEEEDGDEQPAAQEAQVRWPRPQADDAGGETPPHSEAAAESAPPSAEQDDLDPLPVLTGRDDAEPEWPPLPDEDETVAVFHAANEEHLVPAHEPDGPAGEDAPPVARHEPPAGPDIPAGFATPPGVSGGDDPGPAEMGAISGASGDVSFPRPPAGPGPAMVPEETSGHRSSESSHETAGPGASYRVLRWEARDTDRLLRRARLLLAGAL